MSSSATRLEPPEPLRVDPSTSSTSLDGVIAKKKSFRLFKSASTRRKRRVSLPPSLLDQEGPEGATGAHRNDTLGPHIVDGTPLEERPAPTSLDPDAPIEVPELTAPQQDPKLDTYRWAVLYENQRGVTLFSMPHYGSRSLLPNDPAPFTIPVSSLAGLKPEEARRAMITPATLRDYQLPDAKWKWISKYWMVDMRGDGQVDASGFEYNWAFRRKGWRPHPGPMGAGGWVRRRRWVRLMMRPAEQRPEQEDRDSLQVPSPRALSPSPSMPISITLSADKSFTDLSIGGESALGNTWRGDPEGDWERCRRLMRHFGRDGRKLELWSDWLGVSPAAVEEQRTPMQKDYLTPTGKEKAEADDYMTVKSPLDSIDSDVLEVETEEFSTPNPIVVPAREHVVPVLREHGQEILASFIFPDSRARFLAMLDAAGIGRDAVEGITRTTSLPEFWSRRSRITEVSEGGKEEANGAPLEMSINVEEHVVVTPSE